MRAKPPKKKLTLADLKEAGVLEAMRPFVGQSGMGATELGFGDDTAALKIPGNDSFLLLTTDLLVEGVHFLAKHGDWKKIGRKAMAVNLSDVAAMGGIPAQALISIGMPSDFPLEDLKNLYRGLSQEARRAGAEIVGGDTVRADHPTINVALLGWSQGSKLPKRSRCITGQNLYITGSPGDSAAGLHLLTRPALAKFQQERWAKTLINRHRLPTPRLAAGKALVSAFDDLAMIDVSDGVAHESMLLAKASNCSVDIDPQAIRLSNPLKKYAAATGEDPLAYALYGGEDYELLFATSAPIEKVRASLKNLKMRVARIGEILPAPIRLIFKGLPPKGLDAFEHF